MGRVFPNGLVDLGSIPGRVIPKTLKMVLDTSLLNTQQYKVCIKGKVEKSRERSSALPDTSVYYWKGRLLVTLDYGHQLTYMYIHHYNHVVEGDLKAHFSIATTPRCRGGRYFFPGLLHFTLDPYLIMQSVKQGGIKYHFLSLWYDSTWDWTPVSWTTGEQYWSE